MLRAGIPGGSHRVGMRSRRQRDPRNDGGDDQYRICGAADPALHLRSARRSPRRPRDRVRGGGHVPRERHPAGRRGTRPARVIGAPPPPGETDRAQSDGAINPGGVSRGRLQAGPFRRRGKIFDHRLLFSLAAILILRDMRDFPLSTVRRALSQIFNALCETGDLCS
jgi:hypothetical protein